MAAGVSPWLNLIQLDEQAAEIASRLQACVFEEFTVRTEIHGGGERGSGGVTVNECVRVCVRVHVPLSASISNKTGAEPER